MSSPLTSLLSVTIALVGILVAGCADGPSVPPSQSRDGPRRTSAMGIGDGRLREADDEDGAVVPEVQAIDEKGLADALARRKGRIVLVDFWATWCIPCVELLTHTVQLHRDLADRGFDVILVSLDDPESEPEVLRLLVSKGVRFESFISRYGTSSKSMEAFAIPEGSLPHLRLYDRQGVVRSMFSAGDLQTSDIERAARNMLDES